LQEGPLPLRFLAYVVAIMRLLKVINPNVKIQAELFVAPEASLLANPSFSRDKIKIRAQETERLLKAYIEAFYPNQVERVRILFDRYVEPASDLGQFMASLVAHTRNIVATDERFQKFIGPRGGDPAVGYTALHAPYLRSPLQGGQKFKDQFLPGSTWADIHHVLVVGGKAEHIFHEIQLRLEERIGRHNEWQSHRIFTPVGGPPTYHLQDHEPCWGDQSLPRSVVELIRLMIPPAGAQVLESIVENILRDLLTLLLDCSGLEDFGKLPDYLAVAKKGWTFDKTMEPRQDEMESSLQCGWERLRQLF